MKRPLVILTGAGISAESGIATFRGDDGLWERHRLEDVCTPAGFARDPDLVHGFYNARRRALKSPEVAPNPAHVALAALAQVPHLDVTLITQNIDNLHERGGSPRLIHMHGELCQAWCTACDTRTPWDGPMDGDSPCPTCGARGHLRVDVVWFGEVPYGLDEIEQALRQADLFAAIGTSAQVYPAAGFVQLARAAGAECHEFNLMRTAASSAFDYHHFGPASQTVPAWVDHLCQAGGPDS